MKLVWHMPLLDLARTHDHHPSWNQVDGFEVHGVMTFASANDEHQSERYPLRGAKVRVSHAVDERLVVDHFDRQIRMVLADEADLPNRRVSTIDHVDRLPVGHAADDDRDGPTLGDALERAPSVSSRDSM